MIRWRNADLIPTFSSDFLFFFFKYGAFDGVFDATRHWRFMSCFQIHKNHRRHWHYIFAVAVPTRIPITFSDGLLSSL